MQFRRPVQAGEVVRFESRVVFAGRTRLVAYIRAETKEELTVDGFITFVHVNAQGKPEPHGLTIEAITDEEIEIQQLAAQQ
jgi:acyl-CoA hydrolase